MGGGGGSLYTGGGGGSDFSALESIARQALEVTVERPARRRVFLSFRGEDVDLVNVFRAQAKNEASGLDFIDFSLTVPFDSEDAAYIRRGIRARIEACSVTVVLLTGSTHESEWVNWEVGESRRLGKGVVAVKLRDEPSLRLPKSIADNGIPVLPWNNKLIMDAIDEAARTKEG